MTQTPTFNDLPQMMTTVIEMLEELGKKFEAMNAFPHIKEERQLMNVAELIDYLPSHPKEQTVYSWTSNRKIPFHKKGRSIMFDKAEIDAWLLSGFHGKTQEELESEAKAYIKSKK